MKLFTVVLAAVLPLVLAQAPDTYAPDSCRNGGLCERNVSPTMTCNANNCARAVTGTRPGKTPAVTSRQSDCASFMHNSVNPTATAGLPSYASACTSAGAYSSACACWGISFDCFVQGFSNGNPGQDEIFEGSGFTVKSCQAACAARSGCKSFAVTFDTNAWCFTELHTVAQEIVPTSSAPFYFYDVGCYLPS
jgi:hypothetical protein